jgi:hypothetical protein
MPTPLLQRCQPDSIREFRAAAQQRYLDGVAAATAGRRTAAIYLWGYAVEMTLKAAYFLLDGFGLSQQITMADLRAAVARGQGMGIAWPVASQFHNVRAWAELIVRVRGTTPGLHYPDPTFGVDVVRRVQRLERLWSETLRYHKNVAYQYEVERVRAATEWLLANRHHL